MALYIILFPIIGSLITLILFIKGYGGIVELSIFCFMYTITMIGVEMGFHRYFTHKSFKTFKIIEILLAILGTMAGQGGVLWWAAVHRSHHKHSDKPLDPHSFDDSGNQFCLSFFWKSTF